MANQNQLSRWGAISRALEHVSPYSKVFFVGDTDDTGFIDFVNEFPPDNEGVVRVYSSMFDSTLLANTRANRGDVVMVMPGHSEGITADQAITVNGLKFIGIGEGDERPLIVYNDAAGSISLDTIGIHLENFRLQASVTAVTRSIDIPAGAHGCVVRRCSFEFDATGDDFLVGVRANGADRVVIEGNNFLQEDTEVGPSDGVLINNSDFTIVRNNYVASSFTNSNITVDSDASLGVLVEGNRCHNQDTDAVAIRVGASSTGIVAHNLIGTDNTAATNAGMIVRGGAKWFENYVTGDSDISGAITPAYTT